ncbi:DUF4442 domain-containing protein [Winogradskyella aurantiaca]|uniref:DUF4442 domain-containing protein n=1 Tax=Winogradskyella aurantiaca TaxID=2219558 RepID=UPI000E1DF20C|nr:DUF4442 domain-containing protein [Winogradskyella aurantiaca]
MEISASKLNKYLMFKLPSAYMCGVRTTKLTEEFCEVKVKHRWINQNPFNSMFWAVQGMAAELTTGALVMSYIRASDKKISMLVLNNKAHFSKKATGRITFLCNQGTDVREAINRTIETGEGQTIWMHAKGIDENGDEVSDFSFEWTLKVKE